MGQKLWDLPRRDPYYVQTGCMFENPFGVPFDEACRFVLENPPEVVAQVVFGKYVENEGLVFSGQLIQSMIDRSVPIIRSNTWLDEDAAQFAAEYYKREEFWGGQYATGVDFGRQTDFTVISTLDCSVRPARLVYWKRLNRVPWESLYAEVGRARLLFGDNILCDATGPAGDIVMEALDSRWYCPVHHRVMMIDSLECKDATGKKEHGCKTDDYLSLSCCSGYVFSATTKKRLIDHLRILLSVGYTYGSEVGDFGWIRVPPLPQLEDEMSFYQWDDKGLETDCVFSLALAAWAGLEDPVGEAAIGSPYGE